MQIVPETEKKGKAKQRDKQKEREADEGRVTVGLNQRWSAAMSRNINQSQKQYRPCTSTVAIEICS